MLIIILTTIFLFSSTTYAGDTEDRLSGIEKRLGILESMLLKPNSSDVSGQTKNDKEPNRTAGPIMEIYALGSNGVIFPSEGIPYSDVMVDNSHELFKFTNYLNRPEFRKYWLKAVGVKWTGHFFADKSKTYVFDYDFTGFYHCYTEVRINGKKIFSGNCKPSSKTAVSFPAKSIKFSKKYNLIEVWLATGDYSTMSHNMLRGNLFYRIGRTLNKSKINSSKLTHIRE